MDKRLMDRWHRVILHTARAAALAHGGPAGLVGRPLGHDESAPDHQTTLVTVELALEQLPFIRELTPPAEDTYVYRTWKLEQ
jgi:hypothetical protein